MARYAELADLYQLGLPSAALPSTSSTADREAALDASASEINSALGRYILPIVSWGDDLRRANAVLAAYDLLSVRGKNTDADTDIALRAQQVRDWLRLVAQGTMKPDQIVDSSSGAAANRSSMRPRIGSSSQRGWSSRGSLGPGDTSDFTGD